MAYGLCLHVSCGPGLTSYAAALMNCFAGCCQIAGTVMTQRMSSFIIRVADWSDNSCRQCFLKNRSA